MGHFLYYLPGETTAPNDLPAKVGLADRIDGESFSRPAGDTPGPDGGRGMIISRGEHGLSYKPDEQTWSGPFGSYWIGFANADRPGPTALARDAQVNGQSVELLDGNEWLCPTATLAPQRLTVSGGEVIKTPVDSAVRLFEMAEQWAPWLFSGEDEWLEVVRAVAECLAVNYRVSDDPAQELSAMGVLDTNNTGSVLVSLCRGDFIARAMAEADGAKKNEPSPT